MTFEVSKLLRSSVVSEEQPENIPAKLPVTPVVTKPERSMEESEEHRENIPPISMILLVSKLLRSIVVSEEQLKNIS